MKQLKELFSDTLVYGISHVLARFIGYLLVPLYTNVFEPGKYGVVGLVFAAMALFNVLFTMGMESSYIRYAKNRERSKDVFKTLQLFLIGSSVLLVFLTWLSEPLISPQIGLQEGDIIFRLMLGILFFDTLTIIPFAELRLIRKAVTFAVLKTGNVILNLGINFYLILIQSYDIEAVFIANLIASVATALVIWVITGNMWQGMWDVKILKKGLVFGLPFVPAGIGYVINEMMDRLFLKGMSSEAISEIYGPGYTADDIVGIYNACYKLAVFMLLVVQMYRLAWQPFFMRKSDDEDAPILFAQSFSLFNVAAAVVFLMVSLFVDQIVAIKIPFTKATLIGEGYWMGLNIVPVLLMAYWFQGWYVNFSAGIFIREKTKELAKITLAGALITVILNLLLIPHLGMLGSAWATFGSYASMAVMIYFYSVRSFKVPYRMLKNTGVLAICGLTVFSKPFLSELNFSQIEASVLLFIIAVLMVGAVHRQSIINTIRK